MAPAAVQSTTAQTANEIRDIRRAAIGLASCHASAFTGRGFCRLVLLVPWAIPAVVSGRMWALAFNSGFGIINTLLRKVGLIREGIQWLTDPTLAINAVAFVIIGIILLVLSAVICGKTGDRGRLELMNTWQRTAEGARR